MKVLFWNTLSSHRLHVGQKASFVVQEVLLRDREDLQWAPADDKHNHHREHHLYHPLLGVGHGRVLWVTWERYCLRKLSSEVSKIFIFI